MGEKIDWDKLTFSLTPTDTMYVAETTGDEPWMPGNLRPYGNISISPAAGVLNYGQGLFEGMKAYRTDKNRVVFFRPDENARRMQRGADRLKMPPVPESIFIDAVEQALSTQHRTHAMTCMWGRCCSSRRHVCASSRSGWFYEVAAAAVPRMNAPSQTYADESRFFFFLPKREPIRPFFGT